MKYQIDLVNNIKLSFDQDSEIFEQSDLTSEEIKICCSDLRLLNKSDFKMLLKWRLQMLKQKKEEIKEMKKKLAEEEGREMELDVEEEKEKEKEKEDEKEEEKDVSTQLQEVRERLAVCNMNV